MRVLVTGTAGSIGRTLLTGLPSAGHDVVGLDLVPEPEGVDAPWHTVDCTDPDAVAAVFSEETLEGVVHLAGNPNESSLPDALTSHVVTSGALLDAMVEHGVRRFVYASSNHAVGHTPRRDLLDVDTRPRPDSYYGVAKVAAEALISLYADRHGLDVVACRIGSFREQPGSVRELATWLSPGDCVRMVEAALTSPAPGYAVLYGISRNTRAWWDLAPGRALGYDPVDDAETFAHLVEPRKSDRLEASYVGGPLVGPEHYRPALDRA